MKYFTSCLDILIHTPIDVNIESRFIHETITAIIDSQDIQKKL